MAVPTMLAIAIVNMKGGVGKTTTAVHLASGLARRGSRVLLVDCDPQGNIGHALGVRGGPTIRELMTGEAPPDAVILRGVRERLDVIPCSPASFGLDMQLAAAPARETILARRLLGLSDYDAVILDSSPAMSLLTYNALLLATDVIVPVGMDAMAILGARQTLAGIREIRTLWPERRLDIMAVLPTSVNVATVATRRAFEAFGEHADVSARLYRRGIRQCIDLTYAISQGQTIWEYAPRSRAAEDYDAFVDFVGRGADDHAMPRADDGKIESTQTSL
jgi:chromosome partitioning protein